MKENIVIQALKVFNKQKKKTGKTYGVFGGRSSFFFHGYAGLLAWMERKGVEKVSADTQNRGRRGLTVYSFWPDLSILESRPI